MVGKKPLLEKMSNYNLRSKRSLLPSGPLRIENGLKRQSPYTNTLIRSLRMDNSVNEEDLFEEIAASYSITQEDVPDDDLDPMVPIPPAQALAAVQTLKDWEERQDDSTNQVVRQLKDLEKRIKALQICQLQQRG